MRAKPQGLMGTSTGKVHTAVIIAYRLPVSIKKKKAAGYEIIE